MCFAFAPRQKKKIIVINTITKIAKFFGYIKHSLIKQYFKLKYQNFLPSCLWCHPVQSVFWSFEKEASSKPCIEKKW